MQSNRRDSYENATKVSHLEHVLSNDRRIVTASNAATPAVNSLNVPQLLEAALEAVATTVPRVEGEETFDALVDMLALEERPALSVLSTHSISRVKLENNIPKKIETIPIRVKRASYDHMEMRAEPRIQGRTLR